MNAATIRRCAFAVALLAGPALAGLAEVAHADSSPKVKLLSAGKGQKNRLRFAPKVGDKATMTMSMEIEMAMTMGAHKMPPTNTPVSEFDMSVEITGVDSNGDIRYDFEYVAIRVVNDSGLPAQAVKEMESSLSGLKGLKGYAVLDATGRTKQADFAVSQTLDPQLGQMLGNLRQAMKQLSAPFPSQPVGIGARWSVTMDLDSMGFPLQQVATYQLLSRKGSKGSLKITLLQKNKGTNVALPNLPPGTTAKILSLKSRGGGELSFDLGQVTPVTSTLATAATIKTEITTQGQTMVMEMDMNMRVRLATR